jgi:O-antigen ligase
MSAHVAAAPRKRLGWDWWYFYAVLGLWVFIPELRRVLDYQRGTYESVQILSVVPLAAVIPLAIPVLRGGWRRLTFGFGGLAYVWFVAFMYAMVVGAISFVLSATYTFLAFCIPMIAGLWLASQDEPAEVTFTRVADALLWLATLSGIYGIYQFVTAPPWDMFWLRYAGIPSAGAAEPFSFRIFGTLNSQGPFAFFVAIAMLMSLPRCRWRRPLALAALGVCVLALALSLVRASWLALVLGILIYALLSPNRWRMIAALPALVAVTVLFSWALSASFSEERTTLRILDRVDTLQNLQNDESANDRRDLALVSLGQIAKKPAGVGLGMMGLGAKLENAQEQDWAFDNGLLARFIEMGFFGGLGYLVVLLGAIVLILGRWWNTDTGQQVRRDVLVVAVAAQVALLSFDLAVDSHNLLGGVLFWMVLGIALGREQHEPATLAIGAPSAYDLALRRLSASSV